ncbi:hypothetical protein [Nocardiopsis protaetiae]|uniref:hypothetical protein n=1 Tax=Nocardiopsis protaetiae TaxID=3382270 RepID=UPI00387B1E35
MPLSRRKAPAPAPVAFDPLLPARVLEIVRKNPDRLAPAAPGTGPAVRHPYLERLLVGVPLCAGIITAAGLLEQNVGGVAAWSAAVVGAFLYVARPMPDESLGTSLRGAGVLGVGYLFPWSVWAAGMAGQFGSVTASTGLLHILLLVLFVLFGGAPVRAAVPRDRYVAADELAGEEKRRLERIRKVIADVEEAGRALAPHYDPAETLGALREWEWILADRMRRTSALAREVGSVESAEMRRVMRSRADVVAHARKKDERTVQRIQGGLRPVREALRVHRDLERMGARAHDTDPYADLLARTEGAAGPPVPSGTGDPGLSAVREALRARAAEAAESGSWLVRALRTERTERSTGR